MYKQFINYVEQTYPDFGEVFRVEAPSPNLFSFQSLSITKNAYSKIQEFIKIIYKLRNNSDYQKEILGHTVQHKNYSALMSFDFHINDDQPKLIEINTNASHFLTSYLMSEFLFKKNNTPPIIENSLEKLRQSFIQEWQFEHEGLPKNLVILDEAPKQQRAHFEFLMYLKFFEQMGMKTSICDIPDITYLPQSNSLVDRDQQQVDFVYNRFTDFYFSLEKSKHLKQAYDNRACVFSPHPQEYKLLADKERLLQLSQKSFLEKYLNEQDAKNVFSILLETFEVHEKDREKIWNGRKKYFFKPKNSHGGKGVYKGESVAHKAFDALLKSKDYVAQEFAPTPTTTIETQTGSSQAKYDVRVYVYQGHIQHLIARIYVGQTTNFRTQGGGFATVCLD